jgi:hypothetical protein
MENTDSRSVALSQASNSGRERWVVEDGRQSCGARCRSASGRQTAQERAGKRERDPLRHPVIVNALKLRSKPVLERGTHFYVLREVSTGIDRLDGASDSDWMACLLRLGNGRWRIGEIIAGFGRAHMYVSNNSTLVLERRPTGTMVSGDAVGDSVL